MYALGKYSSELLISSLFVNSLTNIIHLRLSSICENARFLRVFVEKIIKGENIEVVSPNQLVSFIDIRDVSTALLKVINTTEVKSGIYNLGSGTWQSIKQIAQYCIKIGYESYNLNPVQLIIKDNGNNNSVGMSIQRFSDTFKWQPTVDISGMIKSIYEILTRGESSFL